MPKENDLRADSLDKLCASSGFADSFQEHSTDLWEFRNWFKGVESKIIATEDARFELQQSVSSSTPTTTASSEEIWTDLVANAVERFGDVVVPSHDTALVIIPVTDQTIAGLIDEGGAVHTLLKDRLAQDMGFSLINEEHLNRWMSEQ